ncbi:Zinc finger, RING-type [Sesbania bispinosa]|nr:Zinc finger, RING-type [Sesbania bispinosa]
MRKKSCGRRVPLMAMVWEWMCPVTVTLTTSMAVNSTKCLIMNWRLHKDNCIAGEVNSAPAERPNANVGVLENSYEEEENINTSPLYLELHPEGTTNFRSPIKASQDPTKETLVHRTVWMRYLQDEVEKSRKEISILKSERDLWKNRANLTREIYQSIKKQSEDQLFVLKTEKESILNAEKQACNVIHSLHERIKLLQIEVQERISEKRRLEEHTQMVESECAKLKKELQEEHKRAQWFTVESNRNHEIAQIAMREAEAVRRELQGEREHVQRLKENFLRDFRFAESRAAVAEVLTGFSIILLVGSKVCLRVGKRRGKEGRDRLTGSASLLYICECSSLLVAPVVTDSLGRPAMACTICLTNEKDLAFGCGHMTCRDCGLKLTKCPICREQITSHIRLFPG